jgi:dTDP-4-dehydrorhamnose reductase
LPDASHRRPELWGGVECSIVRLGEEYRNEFEETGHQQSLADLDRVAALGLRTLRYPVLWEAVSPDHPLKQDWRLADERLGRLKELGITPVVGLLHHGSGPRYTNMLDPAFPEGLARHAEGVARRYPWLEMFTPVNEPLTTARFSGLYGHWYPHRCDLASFLRCLVNECLGTLLAMRAVRRIIPGARLVQTEDLGKVFSTPRLAYQAAYENERRWLSLDLLSGRVDSAHPWYQTFIRHGIGEAELATFLSGEAVPDILGINYYATSERYLDEALQLYPSSFHGGNARERYADVEAVRVDLPAEQLGARARLTEAWERYRIPIAVTEVHHGSTREEQLRWLADVWQSACGLLREGVDIRAVTAWSLFGAVDWNTLLTERRGFYEPGAYDTRGPVPRLTALGKAVRQIASGVEPSHPALDRPGWWRREGRHYHAPTLPAPPLLKRPRAILIAGAGGRLGRELVRHCRQRGLDVITPARQEMDITRISEIEATVRAHRPWAVINAAGIVEEGLTPQHHIFGVNSLGAENLARVCSRRGIALMTFSPERVFDGALGRAYVEGDTICPACIIGGSKAEAERRVLRAHGDALVIRAGRLFGPEDDAETLLKLHAAALEGRPFLSGSYAPDLVRAALDLLVDGETGAWHLSNQGAVSVAEFARLFPSLRASPAAARRLIVLGSERGSAMPSLGDALERHCAIHAERAESFAIAAQ